MSDFESMVEPHRAMLRLHCYRMLGSSHDGEDMVQETMVRAFRARHTLKDPALTRSWLHRIATNVCLDELAKRPRRARGPELGPPADPDTPPPPATADDVWIEPCPTSWLGSADPAAIYSAKESVALAFVAALQVLTPSQRAVLLLRDVVGLSAEETAEVLSSSVAAANSTLHRARVALEARVGPRETWSPDHETPVDRDLLERYLRAWEGGDLDVIVSLLHEDVLISMPPVPMWISGRAAVMRFFSNRVRTAVEAHRFRTVRLEANGRPAIGFYRKHDDGRAHFFAVQIIEVVHGHIAVIDHFMGQRAHAAFFAEGLARTVALS